MKNAKTIFDIVSFAVGGVLGYLFGPCDEILKGMLVMMALDIVVGVITAFSGLSPKTKTGGLSSDAMFHGLMKKAGEICIVIVGNVLDKVTGMGVVRTGVCVAILASEVLSITENASLLGVIDIPIINKALEVLKGESDDE